MENEEILVLLCVCLLSVMLSSTCDIYFGELVWICLLLAQTTTTERNLLNGNVKTVAEFQEEVFRITAGFATRGETLPGWTRAQRLKNGQERRSTYSKAMDRTTKSLCGSALYYL